MTDRTGDRAHATTREDRYRTAEETRDRKERLLAQGKPSITRGISDAIVAKQGDVFFLSEPDGQVPMDERHGLGLYYHDCRFLDGYRFRLADCAPDVLVASSARGFMAEFEMANPEIRRHGRVLLEGEDLGIRWTRVIDGEEPALHDRILFRNFTLHSVDLPVSLSFRAEFADVYAVRGLLPERYGALREPAWEDDRLVFTYDGADGIRRTTSIGFSQTPSDRRRDGADFRPTVEPRGRLELVVTVRPEETPLHDDARRVIGRATPLGGDAAQASDGVSSTPAPSEPGSFEPDVTYLESKFERTIDRTLRHATAIHSDNILLNRVVERSLRDLCLMRSRLRGRRFFAAGVPWFVTLFGRDSILTALQTLAYGPRIAEHTLRLLASFQGEQFNDWRDEQPGKILHELRVGELAHLDEIPHTPYYGTVDATPLFLILLDRYAEWTGDLSLFLELRPNVDRALEWIDEHGDLDGDGFLEYRSTSRRGLINQGWKDSGDAIVNADGSLARPPIALVEAQGYVYAAKRGMARLFERAGAAGRAASLREDADALRERFDDAFWLEDEGFYALALQEDDAPAAVVSSNPGHVLWTGLADEDRAPRVAERLLARDMFSGWGVRTLSADEKRYSPIGYHLGTVWPHDNSIIAAGLRRYGLDDDASRIFRGMLDAASHYQDSRLPEAFAGVDRSDFRVPVNYPIACHPQAWAAGSIPYLVSTMLGLRPDAFERRLSIVRPMLPEWVDRLEVRGLRVGDASADLRFTKTRTGTAVEPLRIRGDLALAIEQDGAQRGPAV